MNTELSYLRARYYSSTVGRFVTRDPLGEDTMSPWSLHSYVYGHGDPVNRTDPSGLFDSMLDISVANTVLSEWVVRSGSTCLDRRKAVVRC